MTGDDAQLANDFVTLARFLGDTNLTERLAEIEYALLDQQADDAAAIVADHGFNDDLLSAALTVRNTSGGSMTSSMPRRSPSRCRRSWSRARR